MNTQHRCANCYEARQYQHEQRLTYPLMDWYSKHSQST